MGYYWGLFFLIVIVALAFPFPLMLARIRRELRSLSSPLDTGRQRLILTIYGLIFGISYVELLVTGLLRYDPGNGLLGLCFLIIANLMLASTADDYARKTSKYDSWLLHFGFVTTLAVTLILTAFTVLGWWSAMNYTAMALFPLALYAIIRNTWRTRNLENKA